MMRPLLPLLALVAVGCNGEPGEVVKAPAAEQTLSMAGRAERVEGIAMSWEGSSVHVGDGWESAQKLFPERRGSYRLRSLPERFGHDFEAHGWETNENQGYGVITYKDLVVAAIYHAEDVEADYAQSLIAAQRAGSGNLKMDEIENGDRHWSLWESGNQRLMALVQRGKKGSDVTILMGDGKVLDALGATRPQVQSPRTAPFLSQPPPAPSADSP